MTNGRELTASKFKFHWRGLAPIVPLRALYYTYSAATKAYRTIPLSGCYLSPFDNSPNHTPPEFILYRTTDKRIGVHSVFSYTNHGNSYSFTRGGFLYGSRSIYSSSVYLIEALFFFLSSTCNQHKNTRKKYLQDISLTLIHPFLFGLGYPPAPILCLILFHIDSTAHILARIPPIIFICVY